jgi:hypothetical protein
VASPGRRLSGADTSAGSGNIKLSRAARTTTELAVWVARYVHREIDSPPTVVDTLGGGKVRAWLPAASLSSDDDIELDEQRAVKTIAHG